VENLILRKLVKLKTKTLEIIRITKTSSRLDNLMRDLITQSKEFTTQMKINLSY
jgi:hypothetical protein